MLVLTNKYLQIDQLITIFHQKKVYAYDCSWNKSPPFDLEQWFHCNCNCCEECRRKQSFGFYNPYAYRGKRKAKDTSDWNDFFYGWFASFFTADILNFYVKWAVLWDTWEIQYANKKDSESRRLNVKFRSVYI